MFYTQYLQSVAGGSESENGSKIQHIGIHSKLKG